MATDAEIAKIRDPEARAVAAQKYLDDGSAALIRAREIRNAAIIELRLAGWSQRRVAARLGLSAPLIAGIDADAGLKSEVVVSR